jgi:hypothetical protein
MAAAKGVREAVQAELSFDPLVNATGIIVRNMNGKVRLTGAVPSYPQYLANYWLPLIPGAVAYIRLRLRRAADGRTKPATPQPGALT